MTLLAYSSGDEKTYDTQPAQAKVKVGETRRYRMGRRRGAQ
jgi:hypothetical protein